MRNFIVTIDGVEYQVGVEEVGGNGAVAPVAPKAPVAVPTAKPTAKKVVAGGTKVLAPMPGMIKDLKVAEGATVKKDQVILVLEAMKMDNDIVAPCDGVVSFQVAKGANIDSGSLMATIG